MQNRSLCPLANAFDIIGDKWTLLLVRDLFMVKHRFSEFADSMEAIPTNLFAERLQRLLANGLIERRRYSARRNRYEYVLTQKGEELLPTLRELASWSYRNIKGTAEPPQPFLIE